MFNVLIVFFLSIASINAQVSETCVEQLREYSLRMVDSNFLVNNSNIDSELKLIKNLVTSVTVLESEQFPQPTGDFSNQPHDIRNAFYYDTEDDDLKNNGWIVRVRKDLKDNNYDIMLKKRTDDCEEAKNAVITTAEGLTASTKFELDVWFNFNQQFSKSVKVKGLKTAPVLETLSDVAKFFPSINDEFDEDTLGSTLSVPYDLHFTDHTYAGLKMQLGSQTVGIELSKVTRAGILELAELAFKVPSPNDKAIVFFKELAAFGSKNGYVSSDPSSKTSVAFTSPGTDCEWKSWGDWSDKCSVSCGNGTQTRVREKVDATAGGDPCEGPQEEERRCNTQPCDKDCVWGQWSQWTGCPVTCNGGSQTRVRSKKSQKVADGKECSGSTSATRLCNTQPCGAPPSSKPTTPSEEPTVDRTPSNPVSPGDSIGSPDTFQVPEVSMQWWFWLIVVGGVLLLIAIIVLIVLLVRRAKMRSGNRH